MGVTVRHHSSKCSSTLISSYLLVQTNTEPQTMFKSPLMSDVSSPNSDEPPPLPKRGRSSEDFLSFCKLILDYENYDGELVRQRHTSSPLGSTGDSSLSSLHDETYHDTNPLPHHHHTIQDISDGETMTGKPAYIARYLLTLTSTLFR